MTNEYYDALRNQNNSYKDKIIKSIQNTMKNGIDKNFIDEYTIKISMPQYKKTVIKNFNEELNCLLGDERMKEKVLNANTLGIYSPLGSLNTGDYITYFDGYTTDTYLVISRVKHEPLEKPSHDYSLMQHCPFDNKILGKCGKIYNYPLYPITNKTKLGVSERSDTAITLNSSFQGQIRADEISRRFVEDCVSGNRITRMIINGIAYKIQETDAVAMKGLILLGYEKDQINANDNVELGIPDYYNNLSPTPSETLIQGADELEIDYSEQYMIDSNSSCIWSVVANSEITLKNIDGNKCVLCCAYNTKLIGQIVTLKCITNRTTYTKKIKIVGIGE